MVLVSRPSLASQNRATKDMTVKKLPAEHCAPRDPPHFYCHLLLNFVSELYTQLPNMSKKSVAHLDKVETVPVTMMTCGNGRLQRQVGGHDDDNNNNNNAAIAANREGDERGHCHQHQRRPAIDEKQQSA